MKPRLPTSKLWTALPAEYTEQIQDVVNRSYNQYVQNGKIIVEGRIYPEEMLLRIGYLEKGRLKQANFEASIEYHPENGNPMDTLSICVDALGTMMDVYFENEEEGEPVNFPTSWKGFALTSGQVYLQYSTINTELEAEADRLLGIRDDSLVHEETPSEDALATAVIDTELAQEVQKEIRKKAAEKKKDDDIVIH